MGILIGLVGLAVVAYLVLGWGPKSGSAPSGSGAIARIRGDGQYAGEVVGESHYKAAFERLLGKGAYSEEDRLCDALLRLENDNPHDSSAVGVYIDGIKVGNLSRADARDFRDALKRDGLGKLREVAVGARVYCGGEDGHFSVQLDLPQAQA